MVDLAGSVPDGLVVFFVSYSYMDYVISKWVVAGGPGRGSRSSPGKG